jgi:hypothetical protein
VTLIRDEQTFGFTLIPALRGNATERTFRSDTGHNVTAGSTLAACRTLQTQRKALCGIGGRVEPSAPANVVTPPCGGNAATTPEGDPPVLVTAGNPRPLESVILAERHDVTHSGGVYQ